MVGLNLQEQGRVFKLYNCSNIPQFCLQVVVSCSHAPKSIGNIPSYGLIICWIAIQNQQLQSLVLHILNQLKLRGHLISYMEDAEETFYFKLFFTFLDLPSYRLAFAQVLPKTLHRTHLGSAQPCNRQIAPCQSYSQKK